MTFEEFKTWCKEHKKEIAIGAVFVGVTATGVAVGVRVHQNRISITPDVIRDPSKDMDLVQKQLRSAVDRATATRNIEAEVQNLKENLLKVAEPRPTIKFRIGLDDNIDLTGRGLDLVPHDIPVDHQAFITANPGFTEYVRNNDELLDTLASMGITTIVTVKGAVK